MIEFTPFPKIARLNREIIVTEKIDGTNAAIGRTEDGTLYAQSRSRLITPEDDNFGFARWVAENAEVLARSLTTGLHFGEWWGNGIQRGYGLKDKRFSLFNTTRWRDQVEERGLLFNVLNPIGVSVVPVLYEGPFDQEMIEEELYSLRENGSKAAPGFMRPEGIVVYHTAARSMFKVTLEKDEAPKGVVAA